VPAPHRGGGIAGRIPRDLGSLQVLGSAVVRFPNASEVRVGHLKVDAASRIEADALLVNADEVRIAGTVRGRRRAVVRVGTGNGTFEGSDGLEHLQTDLTAPEKTGAAAVEAPHSDAAPVTRARASSPSWFMCPEGRRMSGQSTMSTLDEALLLGNYSLAFPGMTLQVGDGDAFEASGHELKDNDASTEFGVYRSGLASIDFKWQTPVTINTFRYRDSNVGVGQHRMMYVPEPDHEYVRLHGAADMI